METTIIILLIILLLVLMEMWRCSHTLTRTRKKIYIKDLPDSFDGFKICHIADFHTTPFVEDDTLLRYIMKEKPDIICVTGDMLDCNNDLYANAFFEMVERLGDDIPIYCSLGNHELRVGKGNAPKEFCRAIRATGVTLLDNQSTYIEKGHDRIELFGYIQPLRPVKTNMQYKRARLRQDVTLDEIENAIGKKHNQTTILLTHDPALFKVYSQWGAELVLSGHLHGGMVRLPIVGGLFSPNRTFFPKYDCGLFERNGSQMYITKGLGNGDFIRMLNPCEATFLTLYKK